MPAADATSTVTSAATTTARCGGDIPFPSLAVRRTVHGGFEPGLPAAVAGPAARSSATIPTCSVHWIVMYTGPRSVRTTPSTIGDVLTRTRRVPGRETWNHRRSECPGTTQTGP